LKDIEQRKKYYQEHDRLKQTTDADLNMRINLSQIDEVYDKIEDQENLSVFGLLLRTPNLCMLAVIAMSGFVLT
jgi:hypothetical protein